MAGEAPSSQHTQHDLLNLRNSSILRYGTAHASLLEQPVIVHTRHAMELDDELFFRLCQVNRDLQIDALTEEQWQHFVPLCPDSEVETLNNPSHISGEPLLKGFALDLLQIWAAIERRKS
jgi:hypothetical protein